MSRSVSGSDWMWPRRCMIKRKKLQAMYFLIIRKQQPSLMKVGSRDRGQEKDAQPHGHAVKGVQHKDGVAEWWRVIHHLLATGHCSRRVCAVDPSVCLTYEKIWCAICGSYCQYLQVCTYYCTPCHKNTEQVIAL